MTDPLARCWDALVQAIDQEFAREGRAGEVMVRDDLTRLRLSARRRLDTGRDEWITVTLTAEEVLSRPPSELAREFARSYYACT